MRVFFGGGESVTWTDAVYCKRLMSRSGRKVLLVTVSLGIC